MHSDDEDEKHILQITTLTLDSYFYYQKKALADNLIEKLWNIEMEKIYNNRQIEDSFESSFNQKMSE